MGNCKLQLFRTCQVGRVVDGEYRFCDVPLVGDEVKTGVCRFCQQGWESARSKFISRKEKERAKSA